MLTDSLEGKKNGLVPIAFIASGVYLETLNTSYAWIASKFILLAPTFPPELQTPEVYKQTSYLTLSFGCLIGISAFYALTGIAGLSPISALSGS